MIITTTITGPGRRLRAVAALLAAAAAGVLTLTGCAATPGSRSSGADGRTVERDAIAAAAVALPTANGGERPADRPVLASRDTVDSSGTDPTTVRIDLNEVVVKGADMYVTVTAHNIDQVAAGGPEQGSYSDDWQVAGFFNDRLSSSTIDYDTADGISVIDPARAQRYLVGRDANGDCVCSRGLSTTFVNPGSGVVLSSVFEAPPVDTATVEVFVPGTGTFGNIPVQR